MIREKGETDMRNPESLARQLPRVFILSYAVVALITVFVVYYRFQTRMISEYTRMAEGVTNLMIVPLDTKKKEQYISENYSSREYMDILKYYYSLKENYPDVYYMYVYEFIDADQPYANVIIDLDEEYTEDPPQESIDWIGDTYVMDAPFDKDVKKIINEKKCVWHTVHTPDGEYLLSYVRPVFNEDGSYAFCVGVDFNMMEMYSKDIRFVLNMMGFLVIFVLIVVYINIRIVSKKVTEPLNRLSRCVDGFVFDTEEDRFRNISELEKLDLSYDNEIGNVYRSFVSTMKESIYYMFSYKRAKGESEDKDRRIEEISKMTFVDGLTGVYNKSAFMNDEAIYNEDIRNGLDKIAVVMMDINNLKSVNDNLGHEAGDKYIKECISIICNIFAHSPVYRLGGDEFAVVLKGQDYASRLDLYSKASSTFRRSSENKDVPIQERYSASIGIAEYNEGDSFGGIVKRADKMMYENKKELKTGHGIWSR